MLLQLVYTADTEKTKLSCLVCVGGVNKLLGGRWMLYTGRKTFSIMTSCNNCMLN